MNIRYYLAKIKKIKTKDLCAIFPMALAFVISPFYRKRNRNVWIICEREDEARDNGYHFFKYMVSEHKEQKCIYAIKKNACDYLKVKKLGPTVEYGSFLHWILYFSCECVISSQGFAPNNYLAVALNEIGIKHPCRVYIQHGILNADIEALYAERKKCDYFIAGAEQEIDYLINVFGYKRNMIELLGLTRFDALHELEVKKNRILVMPTWRVWLKQEGEECNSYDEEIMSSSYMRAWKNLLGSKRIDEMIKNYNLDIVFILHPNMKKMLVRESVFNENIRYVDVAKGDLQEFLKTSQLLITDYSSIFFDMAYMKKPTICYQFDEEKFRKYQFGEGWLNFHETRMAKLCVNDKEVLDELEVCIYNGFKVSSEFIEEHRKTFPIYDAKNCERTYKFIKEL